MTRVRGYQISTFGDAVWSIRHARRLGQNALSKLLGVSQAVVSRYESNGCIPELGPLLKLFCLAERSAERRPILRELRKRGINDVVCNLRQSGLLSQFPATPTVSGEEAQEAISEAALFSNGSEGAAL